MDEIKRKLELIDRQLARRRFHERAVSTCPLAFVAVGLCAGIILQSRLGVPVSGWLVLIGWCAVAAASFFAVAQLYDINVKYVTAYSALICFACLGAIRLTDYGSAAPNDIRNYVGDRRALATIRGLIVTEPHINRYPDWQFARFRHTDPPASFYLKLNQVKTAEGWAPARGMIRVYVDEPVLDLQSGDSIQAYCWLDRFGPPKNPGQFDTVAYLARRNVYIGASVKSRSAIKIISNRPVGILARLRERVGKIAARALLGDMEQPDKGRGLLQALLLGDRRKIGRDTYFAFRKTGLLHFISLSGMHMGILFGLVWWVSKTAGLMKTHRAVICALAIAVFLLVVPPRAPTLRAAVICWTFCASLSVRRHYNPINTLSLAAIILLLIRPTQLFEAGWQLSFASVLGIILFTEAMKNLIKTTARFIRRIGRFIRKIGRFIHIELETRKGWKHRLFWLILGYARSMLAIGLAAWLGGAGILLYHFNTINPLTSFWTVLAFPLVYAILAAGFLKMILFFPLPTLSSLLGFLMAILLRLFILIVGLIANLDISEILIGQVPIGPIIAYYFIIVFTGYVYFRRPLTKSLICTAMILPLIVYLGVLKYQRAHPANLVVTCLDVGHGQAILIQLPGGKNVLFDAGSLHNSNVGARIVEPFLTYKGIDRIDRIVISHNDTDHINGIPEIVQTNEVGGVYANDAFFDRTDRWGTAAFLKECLAEHGYEIEPLKKDIDSADAFIKTLWPAENLPDTNDLTDNNRSLVSLIEYTGVRILLCSDIEQFAQSQLLRMYPNIRADVVVAPHHGSTNTLDRTFMESLNAKILIYSCDQAQFERTINQANPGSDGTDQAKAFYTARDGAVKVIVSKDGSISTEPFLRQSQ